MIAGILVAWLTTLPLAAAFGTLSLLLLKDWVIAG